MDNPNVSYTVKGEIKGNQEVQILLSDGTYFPLGVDRPTPTAEEVQKEIAAANKPTLSEDRISELKENGLLK
jgi:hypothetical protein